MRQSATVSRSFLVLMLIGGLLLTGMAAGTDRRLVAGALNVLVATAEEGLAAFAHDHGWVIRHVELRGADGPGRTAVETALAGIAGQPTLAVSPRAVLRRLLAEPWVRDARIERHWPDRLVVTVGVRRPAAVLTSEEGAFLVAADGTRLGPVSRPAGQEDWLRITGAGAPEALAELLGWRSRYPDLFARLDHAVRVGHRRWDLVLKNGVRVLLPERGKAYGPQQALARLVKLDREDRILARALGRIDLRLADRIFLAPIPAEASRIRRRGS